MGTPTAKILNNAALYDHETNTIIHLDQIYVEQKLSLTRIKIQKEAMSYPYNCIGLILSYFDGEKFPQVGTGFLVDSFHIATCVHNFVRRYEPQSQSQSKKASKILFFQGLSGPIQNQGVECVPFFSDSYQSCPYNERNRHDFALLKLNTENSTCQKHIKIQRNESFMDEQPVACGYPGDEIKISRDQKIINCSMFQVKGSWIQDLQNIQNGFLTSNLDTYKGMSGAPYLVDGKDGFFYAHGIHIGKKGSNSLGLQFNSTTIEIVNRGIRPSKISELKSAQQYYISMNANPSSSYYDSFRIEGKKITYVGQGIWTQLLFKNQICGKKRFGIRIIKSGNKQIGLGIINSKYRKHRYSPYYNEKNKDYIMLEGSSSIIWAGGSWKNADGTFSQGQSLSMLIQENQNFYSVQWLSNNQSLGKAQSGRLDPNKKITWAPFIFMRHLNDSIEILS